MKISYGPGSGGSSLATDPVIRTSSFTAQAGMIHSVDLYAETTNKTVTFPAMTDGQEFAIALRRGGFSQDGVDGFLLNCNGTNASTTFTEAVAGLTPTEVIGSAQLSTTNPKYGSASMVLPANSGVRYNDQDVFNFGTGDFTVRFWANFTSTGNYVFFDCRSVEADAGFWLQYYNGNLYVRTGGSTNQTFAFTPSTGVWYHIAYSRVSGTGRMFVGGTQVGSNYTDSNNYICVTGRPTIGCSGVTAGTLGFNGKLDDIHVVKTGLHSTNFTPPSELATDIPLSVLFDGNVGVNTRNFTTSELALGGEGGLTYYTFRCIGEEIYMTQAL